MLHRRASKRDGNERSIIDALEQAGASVSQLSAKGVPDLLVGFRRENHLIEVKDPAQVPSKRRLSVDQVDWMAAWRGRPPVVCETVRQALAVIGVVLND